MIAYIKGEVMETNHQSLVLLCGNIGYNILTNVDTAQFSVGEELAFYTFLNVREDALEIYGFANKRDKMLFQALRTVSGIGPKSALTILSGCSAIDLAQSILDEDMTFLTTLPGVGKKTAGRIIIELKDKIANDSVLELSDLTSAEKTTITAKLPIRVLEALEALGYTDQELKMVGEDLLKNIPDDADEGDTLKRALAYLRRS